MVPRCFASVCALAIGVAVASLPVAPISGQGKPAANATSPRTPWGDPDLQGVWDFRTLTPMERPSDLAAKDVLTEQEAANLATREARKREVDTLDRKKGNIEIGGIYPPGSFNAYNDFWFDWGNTVTTDRRTSLIVDPPDGRIPWTEEARRSLAAEAAADHEARVGRPAADSPEESPLAVRCIAGFNSGPPITPSAYNNNVQLVQTAGAVMILTEMVHDARIVPLDGRPHLDQNIRLRSGDSRGRWEGHTLVIDTSNFSGRTSFRGSSATMHLIERLTRVDAETLLYEFTVEDPTTWTRPWTAAIPWKKNPDRIYEYACHEANYGLLGILKGARAEENVKSP
jgi:hypothetical protein